MASHLAGYPDGRNSNFGAPGPPTSQWLAVDPRSSSTQSLVPSVTDSDGDAGRSGRRRLLVVYIHGYQGNDASFRQFPFHVHQYLKHVLHTHVIHTKIYPRYKTYRSIELATENFSTWLEPHESHSTDVVLVGHSMGGLMAADIALLVRCHACLIPRIPCLHSINSLP